MTVEPTMLTKTRLELHRVATHILARRRHTVSGRFGLRATPGGIGTPAFGPPDAIEVLRTSGTSLVHEVGGRVRVVSMDGATLAELAAAVDVDLATDFTVGKDTPAALPRRRPVGRPPTGRRGVLERPLRSAVAPVGRDVRPRRRDVLPRGPLPAGPLSSGSSALGAVRMSVREAGPMALEWEQVVVDAADPVGLGTWWATALEWVVVNDDPEEFEIRPAPERLPGLLFARVPESKTIKNRLHLDFRPDDRDAAVARLLGLGATRVDVGQGEQTWVVLTDPEGNEFCVLQRRTS